MFKLAGNIVDCYDDPEFVSNYQIYSELSNKIKDSTVLTKLGDKEFAIKVNNVRKFPIYNDLITKISCAYFIEKKDTFPEEMQKIAGFRLAAACKKYDLGVPDELKEYKPINKFAVKLVADPSEPTVTEQELSDTVVSYAVKEFPKMTPEDKVALAYELNKLGVADQHSAIYDYVPEYGTLLNKGIKNRFSILKSANQDYLINTLQELVDTKESKTPMTFAMDLAEFDKLAKFKERYKDGFIDAYRTTFGNKKKEEASATTQEVKPTLPETNEPISKEASEKMSVAEHLDLLNKRNIVFEKVSTEYGDNFIAACELYKESKDVNPFSVCHASVGPAKSEKYERCTKAIKEKQGQVYDRQKHKLVKK